MHILNFLFNHIFIIALIVVVVILIFNKSIKFSRISTKGSPGNKDSTSATGIISSTGDSTGSFSNTMDPLARGDQDYEGTTGGISWQLKTTVFSRGTGSGVSDRTWSSKSIWKTTDIAWPEGKFLLIMSTPSEIKTGNIKTTGFFGKLMNTVVDKILDIYVSGYFGNEYKSLVNMDGESKVIPPMDMKDFFILTNHVPMAEKFLDDATRYAIAAWKHQQMGFQHENAVDQFGILFAPDSLIVSCQVAIRRPEEVKLFSDFASAMAVKMKSQI